jgi:hypothetical protein
VSKDLLGEAILTVGGPLHEYLVDEIDGVVSVGPHECMPARIAESHLQRADVDFGLPSLAVSVNGDHVDQQAVDDFVFEVREGRRRRRRAGRPPQRSLKDLSWKASRRLLRMGLKAAAVATGHGVRRRPRGGSLG